MNAEPYSTAEVLSYFADPRLQAALISAVVALIVAYLTTARERRRQRLERAQHLLAAVYGPIDYALQKGSLYDYIAHSSWALQSYRHDLTEGIRSLLDKAWKEFVPETIGPEVAERTPTQSRAALAPLETQLRDLLGKELKKQRDTVQKEAG